MADSPTRRLATALVTPSGANPASAPPVLSLRQGTVTFVDYDNRYAWIRLASDSYDIPRIRWLGPYVPVTGDVVWMTKNDSELMILGNQDGEGWLANQSFDFSADVTMAANTSSAYINYTFDVPRASVIRVDCRCCVRAGALATAFGSLTVQQPTGTAVRVFNNEGTGSPPPTQEISGWWEWYQRPATGVTMSIFKANGASSGGSAIFSRFQSDVWIRRVG